MGTGPRSEANKLLRDGEKATNGLFAWSGWQVALRLALILIGLALIGITLVDPEQWAVTTKQATKGTESTTEFDVGLAVAALATGGVLLVLGVLLPRISEVSLPGGAGVKLSSDWTGDAKVPQSKQARTSPRTTARPTACSTFASSLSTSSPIWPSTSSDLTATSWGTSHRGACETTDT